MRRLSSASPHFPEHFSCRLFPLGSPAAHALMPSPSSLSPLLHRYEEAAAEYSSGIAASAGDAPARAVLYSNRAAALQAQNKLLDALSDCFLARALDPTYKRSLQRRADAHMALGDFAAAVRDLEELEADGQGDAAVQAKLAEARRKVQKGAVVDHYAVLGVAMTCSGAEAKAAYRQLALKHHPDKAPAEGGEAMRAAAEGLFKLLAQAFAVLSDPVARRRFDSQILLSRVEQRGGGGAGQGAGGGGMAGGRAGSAAAGGGW